MSPEDPEQALLGLVDDYRQAECRRLHDEARRKAATLLRQARRKARARIHRAIMQERETAASRIRAAQAALEARRRVSLQRRNLAMLAAAWPRLAPALRARWQTVDGRRTWVDAALGQALRQLPAGRWRIWYPEGWPRDERDGVFAGLAQRLGEAPEFLSDAAVEAGLVFESGAARLDASLKGLLEDREAIDARILAVLDEGASS